jgi:chemotaxis signal transduction protein
VALNRGVALPVYDLLDFVPFWSSPGAGDRPDGRPASLHLIVCGFGEVLLGVLGDQVDLLDDHAPLEDEASAPAGVSREYLSGLLRSGDEVVALLDPERLFPSLGVPADRT